MPAHFNHGTHSLAGMTVMVIDLVSRHDSCLRKSGEQMDQDPGNFVSLRKSDRVDMQPVMPAAKYTNFCQFVPL